MLDGSIKVQLFFCLIAPGWGACILLIEEEMQQILLDPPLKNLQFNLGLSFGFAKLNFPELIHWKNNYDFAADCR